MTQKEVFEVVYEKQLGRCFVTGKYIPKEKARAINFMHVLGKGAYPRYKFRIDNVLLVDEYVHTLYDFGTKDDLMMKYDNDKVEEIYTLKERLKYEYYNKR